MAKKHQLEYKHIEGKTYSLFAESSSPEGYYKEISAITDQLLIWGLSPLSLLKLLRDESFRSGIFNLNLLHQGRKKPFYPFNDFNRSLHKYTKATKTHLRQLPFLKFWDRRLSTTERQYHLYMVEIELTNRLNRAKFKAGIRKIALLPYCLREFDHDCKASAGDFDMECRNCSKTCFTGIVSQLLRKYNIKPYIWTGADLKSFRNTSERLGENPAVLGVACIPELVMGMRRCMKLGLPVTGIPLNGNRCIRWMGEFHENSVFVEKLEELIQ